MIPFFILVHQLLHISSISSLFHFQLSCRYTGLSHPAACLLRPCLRLSLPHLDFLPREGYFPPSAPILLDISPFGPLGSRH